MPSYFAQSALLPSGWASDVLLTVDAEGNLSRVRTNASSEGAERLHGPVTPGVPNVHCHAFQRGMAGLGEKGSSRKDTFWSWRDLLYRFVRRITPDDVETIAAQLYLEMLKAGFTGVAEFHYLHRDREGQSYEDFAEMSLRVLAAARKTGIGITHLPALYISGGFGGRPPAGGQRRFISSPDVLLNLISDLNSRCGDARQSRIGLALHSLRAVPPGDLFTCIAEADEVDPSMPVHIHVAEQEREVEECLAWSGARPVEWLLHNAPLSSRWCTVHGTHLTRSEVKGLAESGASVGLCPTTEANLGDGIFPLTDYLGREGLFGIGSDSNISVSPVEELRWLEYVQRVTHRERNLAAEGKPVSTGAALFRGAVAGGAAALGRPVGRLAEGSRADLLVFDPEHPSLVGRKGDDLLDGWIFAGNTNPIADVMVGGEWVIREGHHAYEADITRRYREVIRRLL